MPRYIVENIIPMSNSEAFSRILIDKALEASGWNLLDPQQVQFELSTSNGRADYLLKDTSATSGNLSTIRRSFRPPCLAKTKDQLSVSASPKFKRFPAGSILVPKSGASIRLNHRAILGIEAHVVSHLAVIVPQASLNTRFAYYWLCGIDLSGAAHDADLPSMKTSELAKLQLPVPPLEEQEAAQAASRQCTEHLFQSMLHRAFNKEL